MDRLPVRGASARSLGLPLPPGRMPLLQAGRPLKRWRYVAVYSPELMLCAGEARVAGMPQRWWALALPDGRIWERTTQARGGVELAPGRVRVRAEVEFELEFDEGERVEVVSPHGRSWIWTAKQAAIPVRGRVLAGDEVREVDGPYGFVDESAGYHARHTAWRWSAGIGLDETGRRVAWNLVEGVHDVPGASERTVWVDGEPHEVEPGRFEPDLTAVGGLRFREWSRREHTANRLLARSRYSQPFGAFSGELPGGVPLSEGFGVMEDHEVWW
jgi:hypothetical protein